MSLQQAAASGHPVGAVAAECAGPDQRPYICSMPGGSRVVVEADRTVTTPHSLLCSLRAYSHDTLRGRAANGSAELREWVVAEREGALPGWCDDSRLCTRGCELVVCSRGSHTAWQRSVPTASRASMQFRSEDVKLALAQASAPASPENRPRPLPVPPKKLGRVTFLQKLLQRPLSSVGRKEHPQPRPLPPVPVPGVSSPPPQRSLPPGGADGEAGSSRAPVMVPAHLVLPGGQVVTLHIGTKDLLADLCKFILDELQFRGLTFDRSRFAVSAPEVEQFLVGPSRSQLETTAFIELCRTAHCTPLLVVSEVAPEGPSLWCEYHRAYCVVSQRDNTHYPAHADQQRLASEVEQLLGNGDGGALEERLFRMRAMRERYLCSKIPRVWPPFALISTPLPARVHESAVLVSITLPLRTVVKTIALDGVGEPADALLRRIFDKYYAAEMPHRIPQRDPADFIFKARGLNTFVYGPYSVTSFSVIWNNLVKGIRPELVLVERPPSEPHESDTDEVFVCTDFLDVPDYRLSYGSEEVATRSSDLSLATCLSSWEMSHAFRVRLVGADNVARAADAGAFVYVAAALCHGGELLCPVVCSEPVAACASPRWRQWLVFALDVARIPREARVCFTLHSTGSRATADERRDAALGWTASLLFDFKQELRAGASAMNMWPDERANPIGAFVPNPDDSGACQVLYVEFETYVLPVVFPTETLSDTAAPAVEIKVDSCDEQPQQQQQPEATRPDSAVAAKVADILAKGTSSHSLHVLSGQEKALLWANRAVVVREFPKGLPKLLAAVDHTDRAAVTESHRLLREWPQIDPLEALELLDAKHADVGVRRYAVQQLEALADTEVSDCLLQLAQAIKYEPYHDSALAMFLLRRSLHNPQRIGQQLYWALKGELAGPTGARYALLLEAYLRGCGKERLSLIRQQEFICRLRDISSEIKAMKDADRQAHLEKQLATLDFHSGLNLPGNPDFLASGLRIGDCTYKDSKKLPLWLVFENADSGGEPLRLIFKEGDDLRQDGLTLQMIRLMDKIWQSHGLDLQMSPYTTIALGDTLGMIEIVQHSRTTAEIHKMAGGATSVFRQDPLANWLRSNNPTDEMYSAAVKRFAASCAGYCVATYVLGIGDRHNDNIMLTTSGKLFHIDFGHFLGHKKKKLGINREPAPFVFTPDFAFVMGGRGAPDFDQFVALACSAYGIIREHASMFINLFALMLSTGIPELQSSADIEYLREAFALGMPHAQACERFKDLIFLSLATLTTQVNNAIHIAIQTTQYIGAKAASG
eukprot:m51a1_g10672 putative phosphatidylinositol- -diphosphate 3-kinase (1278) ;mRNA; f:26325-31812